MNELPLNSIRARLWYALHCLPRNSRGERPSFHSIEKASGLPIGLIGKLLRIPDRAERTEARTLKRLAEAVKQSESWLVRGEGLAPQLTGTFEPLPDDGPGREMPRGDELDRDAALVRGLALSSGLSSSAVDHVVEERMRGRARGYTSLELYASMIVRAADERLGRAE